MDLSDEKLEQICDSMDKENATIDDILRRVQFFYFCYKRKKKQQLMIEIAGKKEKDFFLQAKMILKSEASEEATLAPIHKMFDSWKSSFEAGESEKAKEYWLKLLWYINEPLIRNKKILGKVETSYHEFYMLNWLLDLETVKQIVEKDIILYLKSLNYLLSKGLGVEIDRIAEPLPGVDLTKHEKLGILTDDSNPYLSYLLDSVYSWLDEKQKSYFYIFMGALAIANHKKVILSDERKTETFKILMESYSEFIQDPYLPFEEDDFVIIIFNVYMANKPMFDKKKELLDIVKDKK
jgi:hypothetical protein